MSWTRTTATGSGQLSFRVSIEGSPADAVSRLEQQVLSPNSSTQARYPGLTFGVRGLKLGEHVDPIAGKLESEAIRVTIADVEKRWTGVFAKRPTLITYLDADMDDNDSSMTVKSTAGWPAEGVLHIDRETIHYDDVPDATHFGIDTRALWNTLAAYHYTADGERQRFPEVTDHPVIWEGRRVRIYVYGGGDDPQGNGTLIWIGVLSTSPRYDGKSWSFGVDHLVRILDANLGSDLEDPCPIRGIYYPASAPQIFEIKEYSTDELGPEVASVTFAMAGFWETRRAYLTDLNTRIAAQLAAPDSGAFTQTSVFAVERGNSWAIQFTTVAAPNHHYMTIDCKSPIDAFDLLPHRATSPDGTSIYTVAGATTYEFNPLDPASGSVPRCIFGFYRPHYDQALALADAHKYGIDITTYPAYRLYLGGAAAVTSATSSIQVEWESTPLGGTTFVAGTESFVTGVEAVSSSSRYIDARRPHTIGADMGRDGDRIGASYYCATTTMPQIRQGREYNAGNLRDFLSGLTSQTAQYLNTGAVPDVRTADLDLAGSDIDAASEGLPFAQNRIYSAFSEVTINDVVIPDSQLIAVYPCTNASGQLTWREIRQPSPTNAPDHTITVSTALTDERWLTYEPHALGLYNTVLLRTGYDPIEDEHTGSVWKVRDVAAYGQAPNARVLEIAPLSRDPFGGVSLEDVQNLAARTLGVFAGHYAILTIDVPLTLFSVLLGDTVSVTWTKVPDSDGTLGVEDKLGIVIGRTWDFMSARGELQLLVTDERIGGYVPSAKISSIDGASGGTGPFTITIDNTTYLESSRAGDYWTAGDKIQVSKWNSATADTITATLTSVPADNQLLFTADSAWTHAGATWFVTSQVSTAITAATQKIYVYNADSDALLDFSGDTDNPCFTFAA